MATRRAKRIGRSQTLLPLRRRSLIHTVSCWYCDFKISIFNELLYSIGSKHARFLRVWFSVGVVLGFVALIGITMVLFSESARSLHIYNGNAAVFWDLSYGHRFGLSPLVSGLRISFMDAGNILFSTFLSVAVHEVGHALAAASTSEITNSEGVCMEYVAVFLAILFPGALVAFNDELLRSLPRFSALRIYCAGIWHNVACCAVCGLTLFCLPLLLYPLYIYGDNPMVLSVAPSSPLTGYLSPGDVITTLDGSHIHDPRAWVEKMSLLDSQTIQNSDALEGSRSFRAITTGKGYCVPISWLEESKKIQIVHDRFSCPDDLTAFVSMPCFNSSFLDKISNVREENITESGHCLITKDIVKLKKCGHGWPTLGTGRCSCSCSQDETCLTAVQMPGLAWVEIGYSSPYSLDCLVRGNSTSNFEDPNLRSAKCGGNFVFVGDVLSVAKSVQLTSYKLRWRSSLGAYLPNFLEKLLASIINVSAALALLNSMPVYFLDGESILEVSLCYITWLNSRRRGQLLKVCLLSGSLLSIIAFSRIFFSILSVSHG